MKQESGCPAAEDLSALIDGELAPHRRSEVRRHALLCPACGATLRQFGALRSDLLLLRQRTVETDLSAIVLARLRGLPESARQQQRWRGLSLARLRGAGPQAMGGALAFGVGVYLGLALLAGSGAAPRPAGMTVFDAERASVLCAGLPSCGPRGR
ncbi:anti-sigma factor family protein [Ramlibacter sp. AN1133]|uniref:anti-sigma factor family protein n=1 Tax=Ramlibacter sp. AN1133 TaxID=3133429 RepID=UPI0030C2101E